MNEATRQATGKDAAEQAGAALSSAVAVPELPVRASAVEAVGAEESENPSFTPLQGVG